MLRIGRNCVLLLKLEEQLQTVVSAHARATLLYRTHKLHILCLGLLRSGLPGELCYTQTTVKYSALLVTVARVLGLVRRQNVIFSASCRIMTVWDKNMCTKNYIT